MSYPRRTLQLSYGRRYHSVSRARDRPVRRYSQINFRNVYLAREEVPSRGSLNQHSLYEDFVENTTLLGVQHFLRKKSFIWLVAYVLCVTMSIVQSWSVTITFFEQKTIHSMTVISKNSMQFPSVTFCTNTVLRDGFNFSLIPGFNFTVHSKLLEIDNCYKRTQMMEFWSKALRDNKNAALQYLRRLPDKERVALGVNVTKSVKKCTFQHSECNFSDPDQIHLFNNPFYGNCFTFNPAYDDSSARVVDLQDELEVVFRLEPKGYWLVSRSRSKVGVHIHPPGTAPILELPEVEDIFGGQNAELLVSLSERFALKKLIRSFPSCIDSNDENYRKRSCYYKPQSPYRYSLEACMKSCEQYYVGKQYGKINAFLPAQSSEYEATHNATLSPPAFNEPFHMESCNCPLSCKSVQYKIVRDDNELLNIPCNGEKETIETSALHESSPNPSEEDDLTDYINEAVVSVRFRSNVYDQVEERFSCDLSEYLGILGGNMSLWIGLCIISLLEIVELLIKLITSAVRSSKKNSNLAKRLIQ